jgi:TRAP-type uncharacterized transport system fused permease subunit
MTQCHTLFYLAGSSDLTPPLGLRAQGIDFLSSTVSSAIPLSPFSQAKTAGLGTKILAATLVIYSSMVSIGQVSQASSSICSLSLEKVPF